MRSIVLGRIRELLVGILLFVSTLLIYLANQQTLSSCDAIPNTILVLYILEHHTVDMTPLVKAGIHNSSCLFLLQPTQSLWLHPNSLPWVSRYPIGAAIVTAPLSILYYLYFKLSHGVGPLNLNQLEFWSSRLVYEKWMAATVAAASVTLFFYLARQWFKRKIALAVTLIFAFATTTWSTSSQGLWQHGPLNLMVILMLLGLMMARHYQLSVRLPASWPWPARLWLTIAGVACGLLPGIRPPTLVFCCVGAVYCGWRFRRHSAWFALGCLSALPILLWNLYWFNSPLLGPYSGVASGFSLAFFPIALIGLLISPSRGLFVFSPILLFAIPGLIYLWRHRREAENGLLLGMVVASVLILFNYSCFVLWWGGGSYGPRFLTDILPILCLLVGYAMVWLKQTSLIHSFKLAISAAMIGTAAYSTLLQYAGVVVRFPLFNWNGSPLHVDLPEGLPRLWQWSDSQPMRHLRGLYYGRLADTLTSPKTVQGVRGQILRHEIEQIPSLPHMKHTFPNRVKLRVFVQNQGLSPWYGCDYAVGRGEVYLLGFVVDRKTQQNVSPFFLFFTGKYEPNQVAEAYTYIPFPAPAEDYELKLSLQIAGVTLPEPLPDKRYRILLK